jgi:hypothetical protein
VTSLITLDPAQLSKQPTSSCNKSTLSKSVRYRIY